MGRELTIEGSHLVSIVLGGLLLWPGESSPCAIGQEGNDEGGESGDAGVEQRRRR
jgi:hypothetical protein